MDPVDLNELRSIEELRNHQQGVKDEITHLEEEFRGLPLPEDQRDHYRSLVETNEEIDKRVTELDKREKYLKHIASNGGSDQSRVTPAWEAPKEDRSSLKERDIYDLSGVRFNPEDPERGRQEYRDRAMRAIELAHFPTGVKRDEATEYISLLLDEFELSLRLFRFLAWLVPEHRQVHSCTRGPSREEAAHVSREVQARGARD